LWTVVGKLDVVASAPGKLIPADKVKILQSVDGGIVRAIHVRDGQQVKAGQVLIELDPTQSGADQAQAASALSAARVSKAYAEGLLQFANTGRIAFEAPLGTPAAIAETQTQMLRATVSEYQANLADLSQRRAESVALSAQAGKEVDKLKVTLPLLKERVARRKILADRGLSSKLLQLELEEQQLDREQAIGVQAQSSARYRATSASVAAQMAALKQTFMREAAEALAKAQDEIRLREEELTKASQKNRLQQLRSPVDGTVQQLTVSAAGAVVKPAEPIMVLVPSGGTLEAEVMIANKDIGHVRVGQAVSVKLEAFSFTDYGTVPGRLVQISRDAIQDEKVGLVYQARVRLDQSTIGVDGRALPLAPGLAATADIHTGSRRIISYLLSPLSRRAQEAGRER
jgi:hemolysin D